MINTEIDNALALAIGYQAKHIQNRKDGVFVVQHSPLGQGYFLTNWRRFDHLDWNVIGPIAAKYDCFPYLTYRGQWDVSTCMKVLNADTPQKAIALTVIQEAKE